MKRYVVATVRPWNIKTFKKVISNYEGDWHLITKKEDLSLDKLKEIGPRYIFFPHWNHIVSDEIINTFECVGFHCTDLPYGRGGSPLQNLIIRGHAETQITAFGLTNELDAGQIYMKKPLSLHGLCEEIFLRMATAVAEMIREITKSEPNPVPQPDGTFEKFSRRKPQESKIPKNLKTLPQLFDFLRMLDCEEYPRAFIDYGDFRIIFSRSALRTDHIESTVIITKNKEK